jgi:type II secretory pathway pseudopilin PulG
MIMLKDLRAEGLFVCLKIMYSRLMVKNSSQNGSAHVVVIAILVVALLGALGFIFWQNFVNTQKTNKAAEETSRQNDMTNTAAEKVSLKTLPISEFNIIIQYDGSLPTVSYDIESTSMGTQYANLKSELLLGGKCTGDNGSIAQIVKNPSDVENKTDFVEEIAIGEDVYHLVLSGDNCASNVNLLAQFQNSLKDKFNSAKLLR